MSNKKCEAIADSYISQFCIYALYASDRPSEIRYIGRTVHSLKMRLDNHLREATRTDCNRSQWIRSVQVRGAFIMIREIEQFPNSTGMALGEWCWIRYFEQTGRLTNMRKSINFLEIGARKDAAVVERCCPYFDRAPFLAINPS